MKQDERFDSVETSEPNLEGEALEHEEGRRRFLKAGIAAAPFLVTLAARPARAQSSGFGSYGNYEGYSGDDDQGPPDDMMKDKDKKNKNRRRLNRNR